MGQWRFSFVFCLLALAVALYCQAKPETYRIATYNIRNYLSMDRLVDGQFRLDYPKPESEKTVVREAILVASPDLLALQEIGSAAELEELRDDLEQAGLYYNSSHILEADDEVRRVGALWNERVSANVVEHDDLDFELFGESMRVKRGMLQLDVQLGGAGSIQLFVLHLKSKYTTDRRDPQSTLRRTKEAHAARERILHLFPDPGTMPFLIVGDLNDHRNSSPVRRFLVRGDLQIAEILDARDNSGLIWTHYYKKGGEYSLLDYMLASPGLRSAFETQSGIVDLKGYYEGSDHRLVWTDLKSK
ncbi:endonuclease/exonuclease/phosphatase family protein [Pelagicoccus enzymogenes]|uniref:endonuclease/exonuclease/phosphatase family protein n=1 Tax=Pelagicoccus enzymogenes TaxID=2773457 RepID=UPI0028109ACA|nr:endonuclease/exonuclease/phosphatase family protein [Pelagicoccus enzymogenes]MDQ8200743.1 endonuclease/exonuclease/phosphatase family protein [Pelagicoccus enzymogenes]